MNRITALFARNRALGQGMFVARDSATEATVYLYDTIVATDADAEFWGGVSAESFAKAIRGLDVQTLNVRINSPGGDVFGGRAMEAALRDSKANVVIHVDGIAASAASVVAMAGNDIRMAPGAMMMIHRAWTFALGNANDLMETAALLDKIDGTLADTYAKRTGKDKPACIAMMDAETWLTADEAVAEGFATAVSEGAQKSGASAAWDLSAYARAPRIEQPKPEPQQPEQRANSRAPDYLMALAKLRAKQGR